MAKVCASWKKHHTKIEKSDFIAEFTIHEVITKKVKPNEYNLLAIRDYKGFYLKKQKKVHLIEATSAF